MRCKLKEICKPKQWKTISTEMLEQDGYPVYGANGVIGYYKEYNHEKETLLVTCRGATCGSLNICQPYSYVNGNAMALDELKDDVNIKYLYYFLKARGFRDVISGSAQPQIIRSAIEQVEVDIKSMEEQREIVKRFELIEQIISSQNAQLEDLDALIKSRFVEMFTTCDKVATMEELCTIITDGTHQPPKFQAEGIPFIFVSNLSENKVTYDAEKFISEDTYNELYKRTPIEVGDILLSTVGSYGHPAVVEEERKFLFQRHIAYLKPKRELINSYYLHGALLSPEGQRQIEERVKGIAQKTLNLSEIRKIKIPVPCIEQQKQYEQFIHEVDKLKVA